MKSLMEEASSIAKAIEKGWARAGKPKEFTVRIFEEPQKNFFGFTSKPAKVGIFFKEPAPEQSSRMKEIKRLVEKREVERGVAKAEKERKMQSPAPRLDQQSMDNKWTPELIQGAKAWVDMLLRRIDRSSVPFSVTAKNYMLTVQFSRPVFEDRRKEQAFFRSTSYLLLQALKNKYKKGLKGHKIIVIGQ
jgi:predicted RNA-binding protein Jag